MAVATKAASSATAVRTGWTNPANAEAASGDNVYATASPGKNGTVSSDFGFAFTLADFPGAIQASDVTISQIVLTVEWAVSTTASIATLGEQLYVNGVAQGLEKLVTSEPTVDTQTTTTITSGVTADDLLNGLLTARVRASRGNTNTAFTASLDFVEVDVTYSVAVSFPTTPVLDSFDRSDGPLGSSWLGPTHVSDLDPQIISQQVGNGGSTHGSSAALNMDVESRPIQKYVTKTASGGDLGIDYLITNRNTSNVDHYRLQTVGTSLNVYRVTNGGFALLKSIAQTIGVGDSFGVNVDTNGLHSVFYKASGGSWVFLDSVVDTTWTSGIAGIFVDNGSSATRLDSFGGSGTLAATTYSDSASGVASATGAASEDAVFTSTVSGSASATGSATESFVPGSVTYGDTASGAASAAGAASESLAHSATASGASTAAGGRTESLAYADSPHGTSTAVGSSSESFVGPVAYTDAASGIAAAVGSALESYTTSAKTRVGDVAPSIAPGIAVTIAPTISRGV